MLKSTHFGACSDAMQQVHGAGVKSNKLLLFAISYFPNTLHILLFHNKIIPMALQIIYLSTIGVRDDLIQKLLSSNFFTAIGQALKGALLSLTRQVFFLIPLILVLPLRFGIMGVLFAGPIADFMAFVLSILLVSNELRRQKKL